MYAGKKKLTKFQSTSPIQAEASETCLLFCFVLKMDFGHFFKTKYEKEPLCLSKELHVDGKLNKTFVSVRLVKETVGGS